MHTRSASYLRSHRKHSGLSQQDVARLLGYLHEGEVSRHERYTSAPPLRIALGYEALFKVSVSELFPHEFNLVKHEVEQRLKRLVEALQNSTVRGRKASLIARKLEWMWERDNQQTSLFTSHAES
jgi:transcriptional regulator with XRE-family HTH domain